MAVRAQKNFNLQITAKIIIFKHDFQKVNDRGLWPVLDTDLLVGDNCDPNSTTNVDSPIVLFESDFRSQSDGSSNVSMKSPAMSSLTGLDGDFDKSAWGELDTTR